MRLVSWNVNGIRACMQKGFMDFFKEIDADVFCIQETKMQPGQLEIETPGYYQYMNSAEKKGYSGTMVFSKQKPLSVTYGLGIEEHDHEGRVITCEYEDFYLVCVYTPNSKDGLLRLDYRMVWEDAFRAYLHKLNETKSVLVCGDLNVAHKEIDLKNPKTNRRNAGFTDRFKAREKNAGWRIDYFLVSEDAKEAIREARIHTDIYGSDHCPVSLEFDKKAV